MEVTSILLATATALIGPSTLHFGDQDWDWIFFFRCCFPCTTMATFGNVGEFVVENETIASYLEWVQLFMEANNMKADKKAAVLLSVIGAKTYGLIRSLVAPEDPSSMKLEELFELLRNHFDPKPNVIVERFNFHRRKQETGESVADFVAELKRLARHCEFR